MARWQKGQSGNPRGGASEPRKLTQVIRAIVSEKAPVILNKIVAAAEAGDPVAWQIFVRLLPPAARYVADPTNHPPPTSAQDAAAQIAEITSRLAKGELDLEGGGAVLDALRAFVTTHATVELERAVERYRAMQQDGGE
jgi:hypothetical protein